MRIDPETERKTKVEAPGQTVTAPPQTLSSTVQKIRGGMSFNRAIGQFLDAFYRHQGDRQPLIYEAPHRTGDDRQDAYVAAVAEHLARTFDMPVPKWTLHQSRYLNRPWFLEHGNMAETPVSFRRRMIYTNTDPLWRKTRPVRRG